MKNSHIEFYLNNFSYLNTQEDIDITFVAPLTKRRLSELDKCTFSVLNKTLNDQIEYIVFSSQYGEVERLLKMIQQYTENNEISPNVFAGSVHNYPLSFYLFNMQKSIPYTAQAACENSIQAGFLSTIISKYDNKIFCYSDVWKNNFQAMAVNISKTKQNCSKKYILKFKDNRDIKDNFEDFVKLFSGKINKLHTSMYSIERVNND